MSESRLRVLCRFLTPLLSTLFCQSPLSYHLKAQKIKIYIMLLSQSLNSVFIWMFLNQLNTMFSLCQNYKNHFEISLNVPVNEHLWLRQLYNTGKGDQSGKEELFWKTKDSVFFQWFCFSVERSERDHQLQDTIPSTVENQQLADDLNEFYCRFKKNNTNIYNLILLTNVFAADLWWSSSTILISKKYFR